MPRYDPRQLVDYGDPRLPDRYWDKVYPCPITGCWLWGAGVVSSRSGLYGKFWWDGRTAIAHRVAYLLTIGPIPDGWEVDPLCRVRLCVNPAHLEAVPQLVNWQRSTAPSVAYAARESCDKGHALVMTAVGYRQCPTCRTDQRRERTGAQPRKLADEITHCPAQHAYAEHGITNSAGRRECRLCTRRQKSESARRAYARKRVTA